MKMIRVMERMKSAWREVKTMMQPRIIAPIKIVGKALEEKHVANIVGIILGCIIVFTSRHAVFMLTITLIIFMPPPVDPAQPPKNISTTSMNRIKLGHISKSAVE